MATIKNCFGKAVTYPGVRFAIIKADSKHRHLFVTHPTEASIEFMRRSDAAVSGTMAALTNSKR